MRRIAVFAVVQQRNTVAEFRQVSKLVTANFKLGQIPRGVEVSGSLHPAERRLERCEIGVNVKGKFHFLKE